MYSAVTTFCVHEVFVISYDFFRITQDSCSEEVFIYL